MDQEEFVKSEEMSAEERLPEERAAEEYSSEENSSEERLSGYYAPYPPTQIPNPGGQEKKKRGIGRVILGFAAGFMLAAILGIVALAYVANNVGSENLGLIPSDVVDKIALIQERLDLLYLFDQDEADKYNGLIKGYVDSLGDPYTAYYTADEYAELMESTSGTYSGIGVVVQQNAETGVITVVKPYANCPGAEAGMLPNDILYKVAGEDCTGVDINLVVSKIKGTPGTSVDITIYRPSTNEYIDMTVTRRKVEIETVTFEMLENSIGKITIDSFDDVTYDQFIQAFQQLKQEGMEALIVDLRDNGGGLLDSVVAMLDYLLPKGIITYTEDKYGERETYNSDASAELDVPCAILTNGYTASASEIFTGCMKDYGMAVIVGKKTFGKGIVQVLLPINDGSALKVTTAYYYTPAGICIHGDGIMPDFEVEYDQTTEADEQLDKAVEILKEKLGR